MHNYSMKKNLLTSLIALLTLSVYTLCFAVDLTGYKNRVNVQVISVSQPTIVEIQNLSQSGNYVVTDDRGVVIEQQMQLVRKSKIIEPEQVEACTTVCKSARELADGNTATTFDFPLNAQGAHKGKIKIVYAKPLATDAITFRTTVDSYMPNTFTLTIDGKQVLNTMSGGSARFPKMFARIVEIEFWYNQPIRFTEVGVGVDKEEEVSSSVRFVYQPNTTYLLYTDSPLGKEATPSPVVNLFSKTTERTLTLSSVTPNALYKERDTDSDGIINSIDNCPVQSNQNQSDSNSNGIGDVCDDYDYDGVSTYMDNCPVDVNQNQSDVDKDGIGDVCDKEESRTTEKYPWLPWVVFGGVLLAVLGMGYEIIRNKNKRV